jgi:hypothetical protein
MQTTFLTSFDCGMISTWSLNVKIMNVSIFYVESSKNIDLIYVSKSCFFYLVRQCITLCFTRFVIVTQVMKMLWQHSAFLSNLINGMSSSKKWNDSYLAYTSL